MTHFKQSLVHGASSVFLVGCGLCVPVGIETVGVLLVCGAFALAAQYHFWYAMYELDEARRRKRTGWEDKALWNQLRASSKE